jgi:hypothetical protein
VGVVRLVAQGLSNAEIAAGLFLGPSGFSVGDFVELMFEMM